MTPSVVASAVGDSLSLPPPIRATRYSEGELSGTFRCRSAALRGLLRAIEEAPEADAILRGLSPETRRQLARLPAPWAMTSALPFQALLSAVHTHSGTQGVERMAAASLQTGLLSLMGPVLRLLLRSGRLQPTDVYLKFCSTIKQHLHGIDVQAHVLPGKQMRIEIDYIWLECVPDFAFAYWRGILIALSHSASLNVSVVQEPSATRGRALASASFLISW